MNNAVIKVHDLEVVARDEKQSAAILAKCEERITKLNEQLAAGERLNEGIRFLIGAQLVVAAPHVPHGNSDPDGGVAKWAFEKFKIEERTARNWKRFASTILDVAPKKLKTETVSVFTALPEKLADGGLSERDRESIVKLLPEITEGEGMMDFIDRHAPPTQKGGLKPIKFHCPCCREKKVETVLKQIPGRNIKCPKCGETVKAKPDVKDTTAEEREAANERIERVTAELNSLFSEAMGDAPNRSDRAKCDDKVWADLVRACQQISTFDKQHGKQFREALSKANKKK